MKRLICCLLAVLLCAATGIPAFAEEDPFSTMDDRHFAVEFICSEELPEFQEICELVDATLQHVTPVYHKDPATGEKYAVCYLCIYELNNPGTENLLAACDRITETYRYMEEFFQATPHILGQFNEEESPATLDVNHISVVIKGEHPAQEEICTLIDADLTGVYDSKIFDPETNSEIIYARYLTYTLHNPGEEAVRDAVELINTTYADASVYIRASLYYLGDFGPTDSYTVAQVVTLRRLVLNENATQEEIEAYDMNGDGKLSVTDVVLLRRKILVG